MNADETARLLPLLYSDKCLNYKNYAGIIKDTITTKQYSNGESEESI